MFPSPTLYLMDIACNIPDRAHMPCQHISQLFKFPYGYVWRDDCSHHKSLLFPPFLGISSQYYHIQPCLLVLLIDMIKNLMVIAIKKQVWIYFIKNSSGSSETLDSLVRILFHIDLNALSLLPINKLQME